MRVRSFCAAVCFAVASSCPGPQAGPWRSALYPDNWTPAQTDTGGRFLHDFSYAGYGNGPGLPGEGSKAKFDVTTFGADRTGAADSTAAIQLAIDAAGDAGGGVVFVPAGMYRCDGALSITESSIVLRGEGPAKSRVYFTSFEGMAYRGHIMFRGAVQNGTEIALTKDAKNRSFEIACADAGPLVPGADVSLGWTITDAFIAEHGMTGTWRAFTGLGRACFGGRLPR